MARNLQLQININDAYSYDSAGGAWINPNCATVNLGGWWYTGSYV